MNTFFAIRRSIRTRIFTVSLLPVMALMLVAVINFRHLNDLGQSAEQIMARNYLSIKAAQDARQLLENNRNIVLMHMFGTGEHNYTTIDTGELATALGICRLHIAESGESVLVDELWRKYVRYSKIIDQHALDALSNQPAEFTELTTNMINGLNALVDLNEQGMEEAERQTRLLARQAQNQSLLILCPTIILIILFSFIFSNRISRPIRDLAKQLAATHGGGERYPSLPVPGDDEIGLLTSEFNHLFQSLARYDQHNAAILAAEKEKVHQAEEARARFIADLSHQLKTPMTSLAMSVNLLQGSRELLTEEQVALLLDTATEDCDRMAKLLNELVDIARLEAMIRPAVREQIDVTDLIGKSLKPLVKQADEKGIVIRQNIEPGLPSIFLDSTRFPWILTNLISNSLRYTNPGGSITVGVTRESGRFWFSCRDDGCGIDSQYLPYIFDRYSQFSERERMGTIGLGLAIVKEIIEQHGGSIRAESTVGQGTVFTFWIPEHKE